MPQMYVYMYVWTGCLQYKNSRHEEDEVEGASIPKLIFITVSTKFEFLLRSSSNVGISHIPLC